MEILTRHRSSESPRVRRSSRIARFLLALLAAALLCRAAEQASEYEVKAAFLFNFIKFIEWPPEAFQDAQSPIAICVLGEDPFGAALDRFVAGEEVRGRKIVTRRIARPPAPKTCQVLFIPGAEREGSKMLAALGPGVLTIGEGSRFLKDGGIIAFVIQDRRVRFDVNLRAAANAALAISARLLNVARSVER